MNAQSTHLQKLNWEFHCFLKFRRKKNPVTFKIVQGHQNYIHINLDTVTAVTLCIFQRSWFYKQNLTEQLHYSFCRGSV